MARRSAPVRTCVGCRERSVATELLRVVAVSTESGCRVLPDPARRLPGRGASLHVDPECLALAERRRAFLRALRVPGPLDVEAVRAHLTARLIAEPPAGSTGTTDEGRSTPMSTR